MFADGSHTVGRAAAAACLGAALMVGAPRAADAAMTTAFVTSVPAEVRALADTTRPAPPAALADTTITEPTTAEEALAGLTRPKIAPSSLSEREAIKFYEGLIRRAGAQPYGGNKYTHHALLLRGVDIKGRVHDTRINTLFDDVIVVISKSGTLLELEASSHPTFITEPTVMRRGGVGMPRSNQTMLMKPWRHYGGRPSWHAYDLRGRDQIPATRNGPGVAPDATATSTYGGRTYDNVYGPTDPAGTQSAILLHTGHDQGVDAASGLRRGGVSIGCFSVPPNVLEMLFGELGSSRNFLLTLVDANRDLPNAPG